MLSQWNLDAPGQDRDGSAFIYPQVLADALHEKLWRIDPTLSKEACGLGPNAVLLPAYSLLLQGLKQCIVLLPEVFVIALKIKWRVL